MTDVSQQLMEVGDDYQRAAELNKERMDLEELNTKAKEYQETLTSWKKPRQLLDGDDEEMRMLAEAEILELEPILDRLEGETQRHAAAPTTRATSAMSSWKSAPGPAAMKPPSLPPIFFACTAAMLRTSVGQSKCSPANEIGIGGYKEIIFMVKGRGAYSRLKYESGVHRVQRVPVTESQGRIHTSTATVAVLAEVDEVEIDIPEIDIRMDVYRSAGAGGQNVQKNATAVRITHIPTGIVVACQDERSQLQNRLRAMSILRARLYEIETGKTPLEIEEDRRSQVGTGERSEKIRTYNYPQSRVTDHRINLSTYNLSGFMTGAVDEFIDELATRDEADRLSDFGEDDEGMIYALPRF